MGRHIEQDEQVTGDWANFRKKGMARLLKMDEAFSCINCDGQTIRGEAGDYLAKDQPTGHYAITAQFVADNYEEV